MGNVIPNFSTFVGPQRLSFKLSKMAKYEHILVDNLINFLDLEVEFFEQKRMADMYDMSKFHGNIPMADEVKTFYFCTVFWNTLYHFAGICSNEKCCGQNSAVSPLSNNPVTGLNFLILEISKEIINLNLSHNK